MTTPNNTDSLTELFQAVCEGKVTIAAAVQSLRDAVEVIEDAAFTAGHLEGEKYTADNAAKSRIILPFV